VVAFLAILLGRVRRFHIAVMLGLVALSVIVGGALFAVTQGVGLGTGLYWAVTTATTVGYGDVTPRNVAGRIVAVAVMLTAIPLMGAVFALLVGMAALAQIRRLFGMEHRLPPHGYTIVFGAHPAVPRTLHELVAGRSPVVLVADVDPTAVPTGVHLIAGDPTNDSVIRKSHPERARQALVTGPTTAKCW
jgi:voltage-gated potassium channel